MRVRHHGDTARIEVAPDDFPRLLVHRQEIVARFQGLGYTYVTLDLEGYRTGSLNEALKTEGGKQKAEGGRQKAEEFASPDAKPKAEVSPTPERQFHPEV
jgi:hypothetical protein